jgi:shikimate kinase
MEVIFITGPKHSGKTKAGNALAELFSCEFFDIDELVLKRTGKSPRQLYCDAPEIFQKAEADALKSLLLPVNIDAGDTAWRVIATGGGIIDNPEALALINKKNAIKVFLNISADTAWDRITQTAASSSSESGLPPFLKTGNPQETHRILHKRRTAAYLKLADIVIEAEGKTPEEIAVEILNQCRQ